VIAKIFGHSIVPTTPALTPLITDDPDWKTLAGITLPVRLSLMADGKKTAQSEGAFLFTHTGFSGPAALDISGPWLRCLAERKELVVDFFPGMTAEALLDEWVRPAGTHLDRSWKRSLSQYLPERLAEVLLRKSGIDPRERLDQTSKANREAFLLSLFRWPVKVTGFQGYEKAEVTAGGVDLREVDAKTLAYLRPRTDRPVEAFGPDADASYEGVHRIDCSAIEPQVALPHRPDNVKPASELGEIRIQQAFIGSCTNARAGDLERVAAILKGRKVAPGTRLLVIPASHEVMLEATRNGSLAVLVEAGAMIGTPGCGPCGGSAAGVLGPGENGVSSTNRNFKGRMGSAEGFVYLASPETVAASAIEGRITDPRKYM